MVDETTMMFHLLNYFYAKTRKEPCTDVQELIEWDNDWEYYNQFCSQLSHESSNLIPYKNTNGYIVVSKNPNDLELEVTTHSIDKLTLQTTLKRYEGMSRYLVLHVSVWCYEESRVGHSCLYIMCPNSKVQCFFDPYGGIHTSLWKVLSGKPLLEGFDAHGICPCWGFQTRIEELIGARPNSICGLVCSIVTLQLALTYLDIKAVMKFWCIMVETPIYWEQVKRCFNQFTYVYQKCFIEGNDDESIL